MMNLNNFTFKQKFNDYEKVIENYSQAGQDLFVLMCLNGKKEGKFLDLGCYRPIVVNNTYLLEKDFKWTGLSYDIDEAAIRQYSLTRNTAAICEDCTKLNWEFILNFSNHYDYLSLDLEPADITYECLKSIPFDKIKFSVITYEHDLYRFGDEWKNKSYDLLTQQGYVRVCSNIKHNDNAFEDWYVHPDFVKIDTILNLFVNDCEYLEAVLLNVNTNENYLNLLQQKRQKSLFYDALYFYKKCKNDITFYEKNQESIDYEMTILYWYLFNKKKDRIDGCKLLIDYINKYTNSQNLNNVWNNLKCYISTLKEDMNSEIINLKTFDLTKKGFINSSPCKITLSNGKEYTNIRYVNYTINADENCNTYDPLDKSNNYFNLSNPVKNCNFINDKTMSENSNIFKKSGHVNILGLEDIRLFEKENDIKFLATTKEYSNNKYRIISGQIDTDKNEFKFEKVFNSPENAECEKNWLMLDENTIIYKFFPFSTYSYNNLELLVKEEMPQIFKHFRGSANPINIDGSKYTLVHSVHFWNKSKRKYLHWLIKLNNKGIPIAFSIPFTFEGEDIEYCLSINYLSEKKRLEFYYSTWDRTSKCQSISWEYFNDKFIEI